VICHAADRGIVCIADASAQFGIAEVLVNGVVEIDALLLDQRHEACGGKRLGD
jgi:hypothetical protein